MNPAVASSGAFAALLLRLRGDVDAGVAYEALRARLIRYFRVHDPVEAEELADASIDRLARRVDEGVEIVSVPMYALGIARLVLLEARARHARRQLAEADPTAWPDADDAEAAESRAGEEHAIAALGACLDEAGATARTLILGYYAADGGGERIRLRQRLAAELGIKLNALRNRAQRLRDALEDCVRTRLQRAGP
jgi:DNA-directed RNA polymerase specialized sigma24 family protein